MRCSREFRRFALALAALGILVPVASLVAAPPPPDAPSPSAILHAERPGEAPRSVTPSPVWTGEGDQATAQFGRRATTAGDVNGDGFSDIIIGAPGSDGALGDEGRASVYLGSAAGLAASPAWTMSGTLAGEGFGAAVGTAGDVNGDGFDDVIVGAPGASFGEVGEGAAFVYLGSASGLAPTPIWTAEGNQVGAGFGRSVSMAGDVNGDGYSDLAVGAERYDGGEVDEGRVCLYLGSASGPNAASDWSAEGEQASARFGCSVGAAGDVNADGYADLLVGAPTFDWNEVDEGRVFLYAGSSGGLLPAAVWTADGAQGGCEFGGAVSTAGDVNGDGYSDLIVGAIGYDQSAADEGRVCVFHGASAWPMAVPTWTAVGGQLKSGFGGSVGTAGDVNGDGFADVIIGAATHNQTHADGGRTVVYPGSAVGLPATPTWSIDGTQTSALLGCSVATAGDVNGNGLSDVIVGAEGFDNGQIDEGSAAVYSGVTGVLSAAPAWSAKGDVRNAAFGTSVHTAGDVNGDGYSDLLVGAPIYSNDQFAEGRAYLYLGSAAGLSSEPSWMVEGNQDYAFLGVSVNTAGDINGDGYSDVLVGVYRASNDQAEEGLVYLYLGSPSGLSTTPDWTEEGDQDGAWLGYCVGTAGDVNGDGYSDVILSSHWYTHDQTYEGRAYVYHGSPAGLPATPSWFAEGNQSGAKFGISVATAGDVNGDGYSDVVIGAWQYDHGQTDEGGAFLYLGSANGLAAVAAWSTEGNVAAANYGHCVASAGDVNADGFSDVLVGADWLYNGQAATGRAYLYQGSATGLPATPTWVRDGDQAICGFGLVVGTAGDVNADGFSDVVIGAQHYDNLETEEGRAFLYLGASSGLSAVPVWTTESNQVDALLGFCAGTAGDVNGDGFGDLAVATYYWDDEAVTDVGRVDVFHGNEGGGLARLPRQMCVNGWEPIWPLCRSDSETGFLLRAIGRTPLGRGAVRLQYEVKPAGVAFDGTGLVTGPSVDTGAPAGGGSEVTLDEAVGSLSSFSLYHWRLCTLSESPLFPRSPWLTQPYNSMTEADVRTARIGSAVPEDPRLTAAPILIGRPNPFDVSTRLTFDLAAAGRVRLGIYDALGREVALLVDRDEAAGRQSLRWDGIDREGRQVPSGVYLVRMEACGRESVHKLVLQR